MTPALEALLAEAERLDKGATTGPWLSWDDEDGAGVVRIGDGSLVAVEVSGGGDAAFIARARTLLPALACALRRAERVVEASRDARVELGRAWQDWDADRDAKAGKRIANAATTLIDAIHAHDHPDATGETGREG